MFSLRQTVLVAAVLMMGLPGCDSASERQDVSPVAPGVDADLQSWVERVTDRSWQTRKLAQRELLLDKDMGYRARVSVGLVNAAVDETDEQDFHRLVGTALRVHGDAAVRAAARWIQDGAVPMQTRFGLARVVLRDPSAPEIERELVNLAEELITSEHPYHFEFGVRAMMRFHPDRALGPIEVGLAHREAEFRRGAAAALKEAAHEDAFPLVVELSRNAEVTVRKRAVQALEHYLDTPAGSEALVEVLESETDTEVCTRALETLTHVGPPAAEALLARLQPDTAGCGPEHGFVVLAAVRRALRFHSPTPEVEGALRSLAEDHWDPGMRGYAAAALGDVELAASLGGVASYDGLALLTSRSQEPLDRRLAAIAALGEVEVAGAAERLEGLIGNIDAEPAQIMAAMDALERTGKADATRSFLAYPYTSPLEDPELRAHALGFMERSARVPRAMERASHEKHVH